MESYLINRLGLRGDGVADGPVYAARCLPGERVTGTVVDGRITAPKIVEPSDLRVKAPCPHYARCGGCQLQHARDEFVSDWKQSVVREALAAHGLEAEFRPIHVSPPGARRRATLAGRRMKSWALIGFHTRASDTVVEVPDCKVLHPAIRDLLPGLGDLVTLLCSRKGELSFALTVSEAGVDLDVRGGKPLERSLFSELAGIAHRMGLARLSVEGEVIVTLRPPVQRFGAADVVPPPGAFLQATRDGEEALQAAVSDAVGSTVRIADLFAGCGTFTLPLAQRAEVHAVEGSGDMLAALDAGWRAGSGISQVSTETRDLFRRPLLSDELARFGAVVIDPPRAGAQAQTRELAEAQVARIAAVSCNPATFARDAKTLTEAGYRLKWVQVVDQFRWSAHVELVAAFTAPHIAA